jgi:glucosylceramidase
MTPTFTCITTTESEPWAACLPAAATSSSLPDVNLDSAVPCQSMDGFGACFNEYGWLALSHLDARSRDSILDELFLPGVGANFRVCRMPLGANDFSRGWYSYDETPDNFALSDFSLSHDSDTLIPFIRAALIRQPSLKLWASPWCPPSWMKVNGHYACRRSDDPRFSNDLPASATGREGTDMFRLSPECLAAYAKYFELFVIGYRSAGIPIAGVMPQNEFNSCQPFPSCVWRPQSLALFIGEYLGPAMAAIGVEVMHGTVERTADGMFEAILSDEKCRRFVRTVGVQWGGRASVPRIRKLFPDVAIWQTEHECGCARNDWRDVLHLWKRLKWYIKGGASVYEFWNIALEKGGVSRWGWAQNSLVVVDPADRTTTFTGEYFLMKHLSHFVDEGAKFLSVQDFENCLVFVNPDRSIVLVVANEEVAEKRFTFQLNGERYSQALKPKSFSTIFAKLGE